MKDSPSINFNNLITLWQLICKKGGRIDLSKESTASVFRIGLGWDAAQPGKEFDLDAMALMLKADGKVLSDNNMVFYGNLEDPSKSVKHSGDNRTGAGDDLVGDTNGDDGMDNETISVELDRIRPEVEYVAFILNSYRHQRFDKIPYMGLRIYTTSDGRPVTRPNSNPNVLAKYNLDNDSKDSDTTFVGREAIILGYAYRKDGEWKFKALGSL